MIQITSSPFWVVMANIAKTRGDNKMSPSFIASMLKDPLPPKPVRAILRVTSSEDDIVYKYYIIDFTRKKFDSATSTEELEKKFLRLKDSYIATNLTTLPYVDGVNHKIIPITDEMAAKAISLLEKK